jgi:glycosyltransferase involved in cell wall biosynthesis
LRIVHCPTDTGGHPSGLARAERAHGASSTVAVFESSPYAYPVDIDLALGERSRFSRLLGRIQFLFGVLGRYDVVHLNFGHPILPMLGPTGIDLPLLRVVGKRLFATFQGSDARPQRQGGAAERARRRRVGYVSRMAQRVFCLNPDLCRVVPRSEFVPYACVDPRQVEPRAPRLEGPLTIVHAPTKRAIKGTDHVLEAIDRLRERVDVDFQLIEGMPHAEAMARYRRADLAVDQLRIGWYGGFAVEMMAMGKPVVCHIRSDDLDLIPPDMARELPLVRATAQDLSEVLASLASDRSRLVEIGRRSRRFVERWHAPARIAAAMLRLYRDPARTFWEVFEQEAA